MFNQVACHMQVEVVSMISTVSAFVLLIVFTVMVMLLDSCFKIEVRVHMQKSRSRGRVDHADNQK